MAKSAKPPEQTLTIEGALGLAVRHHASGDLTRAEALYRQILQTDPACVPAHGNLGLALQQQGRLDDAIATYNKALAIDPGFAEAHYNLGNALQERGRTDESIASYRAAIAIRGDYVPAHYNLGNALRGCGRPGDAVASYDKAISIEPAHAPAHGNRGLALKELGRTDDAVASFRKSLDLAPGLAEVHNNLGNALHQLGRLDDAAASLREALAINPDFTEAHKNLGTVLLDQGAVDAAAEQYDLAIAEDPENAGLHIMKALLLPVIPASGEDIAARRKTLGDAVRAIGLGNPVASDKPEQTGATNFHLAYHERNNKRLAKEIADMHLAAFPQLGHTAQHCIPQRRDKKDVLRVGFVSAFFYGHTIGKLNLGLIRNLSRDGFEVVLFRTQGKQDDMSAALDAAADKVVVLDRNLERDRKAIEDEKPDILFYPDIGMDDYTYYLAYGRLAPVQVTTWGHPDTTGIPNMDYFISSETLEPADGRDHYNERLIKLSGLGIHYYRPDPPSKKYSRGDYGLPDDVRLYVCPQTLFKFHPDFDRILGDLLRRDPDGRLVLIDDNKGGCWKRLLIERFGRSFPDVADRVVFVPRMDFDKFLGLAILADAVLDIPSFSGGNSSLEAFAMG
ncbi:MAG: tetratricopeptide repeat protein, partial [Alphaproteobacteria bacterium]